MARAAEQQSRRHPAGRDDAGNGWPDHLSRAAQKSCHRRAFPCCCSPPKCRAPTSAASPTSASRPCSSSPSIRSRFLTQIAARAGLELTSITMEDLGPIRASQRRSNFSGPGSACGYAFCRRFASASPSLKLQLLRLPQANLTAAAARSRTRRRAQAGRHLGTFDLMRGTDLARELELSLLRESRGPDRDSGERLAAHGRGIARHDREPQIATS